MSHLRSTLRIAALAAVGSVALFAAACTSREPEKPIAPDAAQQPQGPPYGPGMGAGPGPGMGPPHRGMGPGGGPGMGGGGPGMGPAAMCAMGAGPLAEDVRAAVVRALEDERQAEALYGAVIQQFGAAPPFTRIQRAEERHAAALERLLTAHGAPIPPEKPAAAQPRFADAAAACRAGAASEKVNIAMYDGFSKLALPDDVKCVFSHLRAASEDRHLPVFQSCGGAP